MSQDIYVNRWTELMDALYSHSWNPRLSRHRPQHAFRGCAHTEDFLRPGIEQLGTHWAEVEPLLLQSFCQYGRHYAMLDGRLGDSLWNWLALAQHHGLPTRLLDWTYSPYVALHFATSDVGASTLERDGVIWRVDYGQTNRLLPQVLQETLHGLQKSVFTPAILDQLTPNLTQFDSLQETPFLVFLEPPSLDERIVNQVALFSVMSRPNASHPVKLCELLSDLQTDQAGDAAPVVQRIIIPAALKWEIRDRLDQANINERVLFPGLDGLCSWLRRHYYTQPSPSAPQNPRPCSTFSSPKPAVR